jgi:hypothetical protein
MKNSHTGPARESIDLAELQKWRQQGTIVTDDRRRRPLWFDGRFLEARALNAEQGYFLARHSDYGRVAGTGVITGLGVSAHTGKARTVIVEPGHGLTPSGAQVLLSEQLTVDLAAVAEGQRLDASFGVSAIPAASPFNRTGLYILALRAVEYTGNPIAAYPTDVDAPRTVHDGSVIEATAVSLIPYPDSGAGTELEQRRSAVAREIFLQQSLKGQPEDVLPLAMLALDHGIIKWLDLFMVRREIAQRERNVWGLGIAPRALRAAQLRQYSIALNEAQQKLGSGAQIIAGDHFSVLPPAGPMPASGVDGAAFTHNFFPAEMDVELAIVPDDELPALIEDAMLLPPLDLELDGDAQESTSVLVMMPVPRHELHGLSQRLPTLERELPAQLPGLVARRKPVVALNELLSRRRAIAPDPAASTADSVWRSELARHSRLWYLRRRNLHYKADATSWSIEMHSGEGVMEKRVEARVTDLNLKTRFNALRKRSTAGGSAELASFLASPVMLEGSPAAVRAAVTELEKTESLDSGAVTKVAERFRNPGFGEGLARLEGGNEVFSGNSKVMQNISESGLLPELDKLSRTLPDREVKLLADDLAAAGSSAEPGAREKVARIIEEKAAVSRFDKRRPPVVSRPGVAKRPGPGRALRPGSTSG